MARHQHFKPGHRPFFQCFRQQRVVRVGERPYGDVPGLVPAEFGLIEENAHQFRNRHRRVRVVQLQGNFFRKLAPVGVGGPKSPHNVGQGNRATRKYSLHKAQALALGRGIIGIQNPRDGFSRQRFSHRADEITLAERLEVEVIGCGRRPEAERVDGAAAIANDRSVIRQANQTRSPPQNRAQAAVPHLKGAVEPHVHFFVRTRDFPRIGPAQPIVRLLDLPAILEDLFEHAVFVAEPMAHGRQLHRGHGIQKARCQPAQSAVAQAGIGFLLEQFQPVNASVIDRRFHEITEEEICDIVGQ